MTEAEKDLRAHLGRAPTALELASKAIAAAREEGRREGFEKAREMAADISKVYNPAGDARSVAADIHGRIRAMRDEAGEDPRRNCIACRMPTVAVSPHTCGVVSP